MSKTTDSEPHKRVCKGIAGLSLLLLLVFTPVGATAPKLAPQTQKVYFEGRDEGNLLNPATLASMASSDFSFTGLRYAKLIECLVRYESNYNQSAIGQSGEIGILQFMPETFAIYCQGSIYNSQDQLLCADQLLAEDLDNIQHWTTFKYCVF